MAFIQHSSEQGHKILILEWIYTNGDLKNKERNTFESNSLATAHSRGVTWTICLVLILSCGCSWNRLQIHRHLWSGYWNCDYWRWANKWEMHWHQVLLIFHHSLFKTLYQMSKAAYQTVKCKVSVNIIFVCSHCHFEKKNQILVHFYSQCECSLTSWMMWDLEACRMSLFVCVGWND